MEILKCIFNFLAMLAGFANAIFLLIQLLRVVRLKSSKSFSIPTFVGFLSFQIIFVIHGSLQNDYWMASGMAASFFVTLVLIFKIRKYRDS